MKDIAIRAGWRTKEDDNNEKTKDRGIKRVWRAIKNLKEAGYIAVHRRFKKKLEGEQDYIGLPAVRCVSVKLFYELKVKAKELEKRRKQAAARLKKKYRAFKEKAEAQLARITKQAAGTISAIADMFNKHKKPAKSNKRCQDAVKELECRLHNKKHELKKRLAELMKIPINRNPSVPIYVRHFNVIN